MTGSAQFINIGSNLKLWVEIFGNNNHEASLLISGARANSSFWSDRLCKSLVTNGFFVVKYDHRDFGYSSVIDFNKNPYDFMQLVTDALSVLDSLKVKTAHMVGHSMGGFITQLLGIHYPERVISITTASASTNSPDVPSTSEKTWKIFMENNPQNDFENDLKEFMQIWEYLNGTAKFDKELAIEYTKNLYARQVIKGALGASHVKAQASLTDRTQALKKVKKPTLVLHGEEDFD
jgi:pimeloyl-ACP methyl ester carboxylesterase